MMEILCKQGYITFWVDSILVVLTHAQAQELRAWLEKNHELLRPNKNWSECPYEGHADDCTCNGMGGDR